MPCLLKNRTVYLAGPIEVDNDPGSWRDRLTDGLAILGLRVWNPLVKPEWCTQITGDDQRNDLIKFKDGIKLFGGRNGALDRNREIREVCLRLVSACDFIICKIGGKTVGTFEELAHAAMMKKPVLFIGEVDSCWRVAQFYNNDPIFFANEMVLLSHLAAIDEGLQEVDNLSWIFLNNKWIDHASKP